MQDNVAFVSSHICFSANDTTSFFMAEKNCTVCIYKQPFLYSSVADRHACSLAVLSWAVRTYDAQIPNILKPPATECPG